MTDNMMGTDSNDNCNHLFIQTFEGPLRCLYCGYVIMKVDEKQDLDKTLPAAEELGKSLAKILLSEKYDKYSIQESIGILNLALPVAVDILLKTEQEQQDGE